MTLNPEQVEKVIGYINYVIQMDALEGYSMHPDSVKKLTEALAILTPSESVETEEAGCKDLAWKILGDLYYCGRDWSAWSYGTMTRDDFGLAVDDDNILSDAIDAIQKFVSEKATSAREQGAREEREKCAERAIAWSRHKPPAGMVNSPQQVREEYTERTLRAAIMGDNGKVEK